jgi:hypothetical protein
MLDKKFKKTLKNSSKFSKISLKERNTKQPSVLCAPRTRGSRCLAISRRANFANKPIQTYLKGSLQIVILVVSVFAFAYIIEQSNYDGINVVKEKKGGALDVLKFIVSMIFSEKNLVSAIEGSDLDPDSGGVSTCPVGKDGSVCQEYPKSECAENCDGSCFPTRRINVPSCKLGTCFDGVRGTCQEGSPKAVCEDEGGTWLDDPAGNVPKCQKACCRFGDQVRPLVTARECENIGEVNGIEVEYRSDIRNELACIALGQEKLEGACLFESETVRRCSFTTGKDCRANGGTSFPGILCTHPDLEMGYEKQASARCVDDKLYWFDSEGNRENVYDANKVESWNSGNILLASNSCEVGNGRDPLNNQRTCGNCNRFLGSVCGAKTSNEKLSDGSIDFVCRDVRCIDSSGEARENGESWCEYQGAIGVDDGAGGFSRSVDTPGSRHFRASCFDGEIQIDPCQDYRNQVCVENQEERDSDREKVSSAACVSNLWQLCLEYNTNIKGEGEIREKSIEKRDNDCEENPMCVMKSVLVDSGFQFDTCVPKYSPGFDLQKNAEGSELSCSFANQKCTVVYVKGFSGWKCKQNCNCRGAEFTGQMNDLCMSLGDCGASVNYQGDFSENYKVVRAPPLTDRQIEDISEYSEPRDGDFAEIENISKYLDAVGGLEALGAGGVGDSTPDELLIGGTISGVLGGLMIANPGLFTAGEIIASKALEGTFLVEGKFVDIAIGGPELTAFGSALAGAAIGFAVTSLLIQFTGIGAGLDPAVTWALIGAGTASGLAIGLALSGVGTGGATGLAGLGTLTFIPILGWVLALVVIIVITVFAALGIGDSKKRIVEFTCNPWQPVLGGDKCGECGEDGKPCSPYACQSLGQTCRLLNEGTGEEVCYDIGEGDVSAPRVVSGWDDVLSEKFRYDEFSERGMKVVSEENDGCIKSNQELFFGINLDEPGQCRINLESTSNYDEMLNDNGDYFGSRNLFLKDHAHRFEVPDLTSLVPGYDPTRRADLDLHVRCIDGNGNGKNSREFVINLCVKPGKDETGPVVTGREPFREAVAFGTEDLQGAVLLNEPSTCRWSFDEEEYDEMENVMECETDVVDRSSIFGWKCDTTFDIEKNEELFYIQCRDQPWYGEDWDGEGVDLAGDEFIEPDESKRNDMLSAYPFVVKKTRNPLSIDGVSPNNGTLVFGVQPATVVLKVETSGGIDNGNAICYLFEKRTGNEMQETFGSTHTYEFTQIFSGDYEFPIICEDSVGNSAEAVSKFNVDLDVTPPIITRVFDDGGLIVITNENSECAFVKGGDSDCGFNFADGDLMSGTEKRHSAGFDGGQSHYIKCKDRWDNVQGECGVIVRGAES